MTKTMLKLTAWEYKGDDINTEVLHKEENSNYKYRA